MSNSTVHPKPPKTISTVIMSSRTGLVSNLAKLLPVGNSGKILNPALLNADTDKKVEFHNDSPNPIPSRPRTCQKMPIVPKTYRTNTSRTTLRPIRLSPCIPSTPTVSRINPLDINRSWRVDRCPITNNRKVLTTMNPSPPTNINRNITVCPNPLQ